MNLSVLERMARDGDMSVDGLRYLLGCKGECEWLDFKEDLHIDLDKELCDFARDVLAIKNTGGGFIVVGVIDKTWVLRGIPSPLAYDGKLLRDKVRKSTGVDLDLDIVQHEIHVTGSTKRFALILIRSSKKRRKRRTPTLVQKDYCASKPFGLRRGEIFVRRGDSTVKIQSDSDLGRAHK
jgi:predicted HTH transcriptional regulator